MISVFGYRSNFKMSWQSQGDSRPGSIIVLRYLIVIRDIQDVVFRVDQTLSDIGISNRKRISRAVFKKNGSSGRIICPNSSSRLCSEDSPNLPVINKQIKIGSTRSG